MPGGDLERWLDGLGLARYLTAFQDHDISLDLLGQLTAEDLQAIGITSVGNRRRILTAAALLPKAKPSGPEAAASPATLRAEQRIVTAMFCDLVGSTRLSSLLDPEDYRDLIDQFRAMVATALAPYNGHAARFLGDGIVVFFGTIGHQDQTAETAVAAAVEILRSVHGRATVAGQRLEVRVGLATGLAVVDHPDAPRTPNDDGVIGEIPNLAARLQALAEPGELVVSQATRDRLGQLFSCEDKGLVVLKGISAPVRAWRVLGHAEADSRFDALRMTADPGGFVGRRAELGVLERQATQARAGQGRITLICGPSGIGKSRLAREALSLGRDGALPPAVLQCRPYHTATPFNPLRSLVLRRIRETTGSDSEEAVADFLGGLGLAGPRQTGLIADLLSFGMAPIEPQLASEERRTELMGFLAELVIAMGRAAGAVLAEDMHWIDPSTSELLALVAQRIGAEPIHLVCTLRDSPLPDWSRLAGHVEVLALDRLKEADLDRLIRRLAEDSGKGRALTAAQIADIAARSDGSPVFAEELTRYILDLGADGSSVDPHGLPATLADSLLARLDRLGPAKRLAQISSVIAGEFPRTLLEAVAELSRESLDQAVDGLLRAGVLTLGHSVFGPGLAFRHALFKDAAYQSLLRSDRVALHGRIARVLTEKFPAITGALPQVVAVHFSQGGFPDKAIQLWDSAGTQAARRSAYSEAIGLFRQALEDVARLPPGADVDRTELGLRVNLVTVLIASLGFHVPEVAAEMQRIETLGTEARTGDQLIGLLVSKWSFLGANGQLGVSLEVGRQLYNVCQSGGEVERLLGHRIFGTGLLFVGRFADALRELQAFMAAYQADRHAQGLARFGTSDHPTMTAVGLAELAVIADDDAAAAHWGRQAEAFALASGRAHDLCNVTLFIGCILPALRGRLDLAAAEADRLRVLAREHDLPVWSGYADLFTGIDRIARGDVAEGQVIAARGIAAVAGSAAFLAFCMMFHAEACLQRGLVAEARRSFAQIDPQLLAEENWLSAELDRIGAAIARAEGTALEEVSAVLLRAQTVARRQGAVLFQRKIDSALADLQALGVPAD